MARSFVAELGREHGGSADVAVVASVLALARGLGMEVVSEGVETEAQRQMLIALGCAVGQGWLFGRAAPLGAPDAA